MTTHKVTRRAGSVVYLHKEPTLDSEQLDTLSPGDEVTVTGNLTNNMFPVTFASQSGWIWGQALEEITEEEVSTGSGRRTAASTGYLGRIVNSGGAPVRGFATQSTTSYIRKLLPAGKIVQVVAPSATAWTEIITDGDFYMWVETANIETFASNAQPWDEPAPVVNTRFYTLLYVLPDTVYTPWGTTVTMDATSKASAYRAIEYLEHNIYHFSSNRAVISATEGPSNIAVQAADYADWSEFPDPVKYKNRISNVSNYDTFVLMVPNAALGNIGNLGGTQFQACIWVKLTTSYGGPEEILVHEWGHFFEEVVARNGYNRMPVGSSGEAPMHAQDEYGYIYTTQDVEWFHAFFTGNILPDCRGGTQEAWNVAIP